MATHMRLAITARPSQSFAIRDSGLMTALCLAQLRVAEIESLARLLIACADHRQLGGSEVVFLIGGGKLRTSSHLRFVEVLGSDQALSLFPRRLPCS